MGKLVIGGYTFATRGSWKITCYVLAVVFTIMLVSTLKTELKNMNGAIEKEKLIIKEAHLVNFKQIYSLQLEGVDNSAKIEAQKNLVDGRDFGIECQRFKIHSYYGGGRELEAIYYADKTEAEFKKTYKYVLVAHGWQQDNNSENVYVKGKLILSYKFVDNAQYEKVKHLRGKTIMNVKVIYDNSRK